MLGSFEVRGEYESDNEILRKDRRWADKNNVNLHPSITVNNITYVNETGYNLAMAICEAYREAPDECTLSWKIALGNNTDFEDEVLPDDPDTLLAMGTEQAVKAATLLRKQKVQLFLVIIVFLMVNLGVLICVRARMKR